VGCEPGDLGGDDGLMGLTPAVSGVVEQAAALVESLIERELQKV
jgi:hypothetical protein